MTAIICISETLFDDVIVFTKEGGQAPDKGSALTPLPRNHETPVTPSAPQSSFGTVSDGVVCGACGAAGEGSSAATHTSVGLQKANTDIVDIRRYYRYHSATMWRAEQTSRKQVERKRRRERAPLYAVI